MKGIFTDHSQIVQEYLVQEYYLLTGDSAKKKHFPCTGLISHEVYQTFSVHLQKLSCQVTKMNARQPVTINLSPTGLDKK